MKKLKFLIQNKKLMSEWDYEKNKNIDVSKITFSSGKKYWWKCSKGHSHYASVASKNKEMKCPVCNGHKVLIGYNDLFTVCPNLKKEWDFENNILNPYKLTAGSNKIASWVCVNGHHFNMKISHRKDGHGCPYCSGNKILSGFNDLETWCKNHDNHTLKKWDYIKNNILPSECSKTSNLKVWWKCDICGYEYKNSIGNEVSNIYCPKCNKRNKTSFPEQVIYFYLKKEFHDAINGYKDKKNGITEIDIYIPSLKIGVEYDGINWHGSDTTYKKELLKYNACRNNNIHLIRFKEKVLERDFKTCDEILTSSYNIDISKFNDEVQSFINRYNDNIKIDIEKDRVNIYNQYLSILKNKSLATLYPEIAKEWDYEKNSPLTPEMIPAFINEKFYFVCNKGHSYEINVSKRTSRGDSCPICSGKRVQKGYNDLATTNPELLKEWDYEKNIIKPEEISRGYDKKVWWKCKKCGNSYYSSPNSRSSQNVGCKYCNGGVAKKVNQYDKNGNYIKTYDSCSEAARILEVSNSAISNACKKHSLCSEYQWRYQDESNINKDSIGKYNSELFNNKEVCQYTLDGEYIKSYSSITIAQRETGASKIGMVCVGKRHSSGGYIWKYKEK